jgi:hypothetical protein
MMPTDMELFIHILADVQNDGTRTAVETDQVRQLRARVTLLGLWEKSALPHPIHKGKTIGEVREESLRRTVISFLSAVL